MADPPAFPHVRWDRYTVAFSPLPASADLAGASAVIVFAWSGFGWVLADIEGRGWTVPSGRVEPGETAWDAALRETREEIGAELREARLIGLYRLVPDGGEAVRVPAFAGRVQAWGDIPRGSESRGAREVAPQELPGVYYTWDALLAAVFAYARHCWP